MGFSYTANTASSDVRFDGLENRARSLNDFQIQE